MHKTNDKVKIPYENCVVCAFNNPVFAILYKSIRGKVTAIYDCRSPALPLEFATRIWQRAYFGRQFQMSCLPGGFLYDTFIAHSTGLLVAFVSTRMLIK